MCLVFIAFQTAGCAPVMIGANREESRRRPATSPVCCTKRSLRCLIAGADHGPDGSFPQLGTWLGLNEAGLAVAVTNRRDTELAWADQVRSKGLLAVELLGCSSAAEALALAHAELARPGYGGCNILVAGARSAFVLEAPGPRRISVHKLEPGIHAMTNLDLDDPTDLRIRLVLSSLEPLDFLTSAARICRDERVIIEGEERGTVSSSLILSGDDLLLYHIRGDPCSRSYEEFRLIHGHRHTDHRSLLQDSAS
jgi:uncharacterized protein with NRDE domain